PLLLVESRAVERYLPSALAACGYWRELGLATTLVATVSNPEAFNATHGSSGIPGFHAIGLDRLAPSDLSSLRALAHCVVERRFPDLEAGPGADDAGTGGEGRGWVGGVAGASPGAPPRARAHPSPSPPATGAATG